MYISVLLFPNCIYVHVFQNVLNTLNEKLSIKCSDHFSLATEHVKITRKNRLTVLDPKDTLAKVSALFNSFSFANVFFYHFFLNRLTH